MSTKHLNQYELAKRWTISQRTLERWRWAGKGPAYLKIGGRVAYELLAIETFEELNRKQSVTAPLNTEVTK